MELYQQILLYIGVLYVLPGFLCLILLWDISRREPDYYEDDVWDIPKALLMLSAMPVINWYMLLAIIAVDWKIVLSRRKRAKRILKDLKKKVSDNPELCDKLDDIIKNI